MYAEEVEVAMYVDVLSYIMVELAMYVDVLSYIMVDDEEYIMLEEELSQDEPLQP